MGREEFTIRITKKGEVIIELDGVPVKSIRSLTEFFEETLGPVTPIETGDDGGGEGQVGLPEEDEEEERRRERRPPEV